MCGAERKGACGTELSVSASISGTEGCDHYAPAESFLLRIGEDIDWSDVGAVLEREDSTKGASNPKSATRKSTAAAAAAARRSSCGAAAVVVVIGGLQPTGGKQTAREHERRRSCSKPGRVRAFATEEEPASPKVSCLGGVRVQPELEPAAAGRRGWWGCVLAALVSCCGRQSVTSC